MSDAITAEIRGILRGALAATTKAHDMARDVRRAQATDAIGRAGILLLSAIARLEDETLTPQPESVASGPDRQTSVSAASLVAGSADETTKETTHV